jgi:hypothetical protein
MEGTGKPEYAKCVDISTKSCFARNDVARYHDNGFLFYCFLGKLVYGTITN